MNWMLDVCQATVSSALVLLITLWSKYTSICISINFSMSLESLNNLNDTNFSMSLERLNNLYDTTQLNKNLNSGLCFKSERLSTAQYNPSVCRKTWLLLVHFIHFCI